MKDNKHHSDSRPELISLEWFSDTEQVSFSLDDTLTFTATYPMEPYGEVRLTLLGNAETEEAMKSFMVDAQFAFHPASNEQPMDSFSVDLANEDAPPVPQNLPEKLKPAIKITYTFVPHKGAEPIKAISHNGFYSIKKDVCQSHGKLLSKPSASETAKVSSGAVAVCLLKNDQPATDWLRIDTQTERTPQQLFGIADYEFLVLGIDGTSQYEISGTWLA